MLVPMARPACSDHRDRPEPLVPILILDSARSGSTMLMQLLGTSPLIAFDRLYPYENPYLLYLVHVARLLGRPVARTPDWNRRALLRPRLDRVGPFPMGRRAQILSHHTADPLWARSLRALWGEYSEQARAAMSAIGGEDAPPAVMYAEKSQDWVVPILEEAGVEHRKFYLLRDPRDVYLSIIAFDARRGTDGGFGRRTDDTAESFAERFVVQRRPLLERMASGAIPADEIIHYHALVADLEGEARRLGALLGVALDAAAVHATEADQGRHITAGSVVASVGRWQREMSPEIRAIFTRELGDLLTALGWEA